MTTSLDQCHVLRHLRGFLGAAAFDAVDENHMLNRDIW